MMQRGLNVLVALCVLAGSMARVTARPAGSGPQAASTAPEAAADPALVGTWIMTAVTLPAGQTIPDVSVGQDWMTIAASTWTETIDTQLTGGKPVVRTGTYRVSGDVFTQRTTGGRGGSGAGWKFAITGDTLVFTLPDATTTTWRRLPTGMVMAQFLESLHQPFIASTQAAPADPPVK
jgi:hypothetical protein